MDAEEEGSDSLGDETLEDEILLSEDDLRQMSSSSYPPGSVLRIVDTTNEGYFVSKFDGYLSPFEGGGFRAVLECEIWPKFWNEAIGARWYLQLLRDAVAARAVSSGDVVMLDLDDSDDVLIRLSYEVLVGKSLSAVEALEAARYTQSQVLRPLDDVLSQVERTLASASQGLIVRTTDSFGELLARVEKSGSTSEKGESLERLVVAAIESVEGFMIHSTNLNTDTEEIDIEVLNGATDPVFQKEGSVILVECKNWSKPAPRSELSILESKIRNRRNRCTAAFFVSWNGFTGPARLEQLRASREDYAIGLISGSDITTAASGGREGFAKLFREALLRAINQ